MQNFLEDHCERNTSKELNQSHHDIINHSITILAESKIWNCFLLYDWTKCRPYQSTWSDSYVPEHHYAWGDAGSLACRSDHVTSLFTGLHWLPRQLLIQHKRLVLTFKCIHDLSLPPPPYLSFPTPHHGSIFKLWYSHQYHYTLSSKNVLLSNNTSTAFY